MSGLALFEIASFSAFAKLLLAARKLAEDGGALDRLKALADLAENGSKLTAALGERDLGPLAARIEADCRNADAAFAHEPGIEDARTVFRDAAPVALAQCDPIAKADLQETAIVQKMVEAVDASDYARAFRETALPESYFRAVMEAALKAMLSDPQFIDGLSSQLWRESLRRQGIEISLLKEVKEDTGAIRADTSALRGEVAALRTMLVDTLERTGEAAAARQSGISDARIVALAQEVAEDVTDPSVAFRELERAVEDAKAFRERAARGSNTDTLVTDLLRRLDALANDGKLAEAQGEADAAVQKWEAEEEAQRERATATGIELLDAALKQDMALRDAKAAARRLVRKAELDGAGNFAALRKLQDDWYVSGRDRGLNLDLEISIEIARLNFDRAIGPDERGNALNDLGISLGELGEREAGTARLE